MSIRNARNWLLWAALTWPLSVVFNSSTGPVHLSISKAGREYGEAIRSSRRSPCGLGQLGPAQVRRGHQKHQALTVWPWPTRSCSTGSLNTQLESPVMFALRRHSSDQAPLEHSWLGTVRQQNQGQEPKGHSQGHIHILAVGNDPQWNIYVLSKHPR